MNPTKTYQNFSYEELLSFSHKNPYRTRTLNSVEILQKEDTLEWVGLPQYTIQELQPTGWISLCACIDNPSYYSLASVSARSTLLMDLTTSLQQKTEQLKTSSLSRKRKKIYDLISSDYDQRLLEPKEVVDLVQGLCAIQQVHFIMIHKECKRISFSSDPTQWNSDYPIWIIDGKARWIANSLTQSTHHSWLSSIESEWQIQWPDWNGTKAECVAVLSTLPDWKEEDQKELKDILAKRFSRHQTLEAFKNLNQSLFPL
jgi:hypothetical protein